MSRTQQPSRRPRHSARAWLLVLLAGCAAPGTEGVEREPGPGGASQVAGARAAADPVDVQRLRADSDAVEAVLDDWHRAASVADEARYLQHLSDIGVFLGTDATERWGKEAFAAFVHENFVGRGQGWTFESSARRTVVDGDVAWFDEQLESANYGELRGSGVLRREPDGVWRIVQYNLTFTVPNDVAREVVGRIRAFQEETRGGGAPASGASESTGQ